MMKIKMLSAIAAIATLAGCSGNSGYDVVTTYQIGDTDICVNYKRTIDFENDFFEVQSRSYSCEKILSEGVITYSTFNGNIAKANSPIYPISNDKNKILIDGKITHNIVETVTNEIETDQLTIPEPGSSQDGFKSETNYTYIKKLTKTTDYDFYQNPEGTFYDFTDQKCYAISGMVSMNVPCPKL
ncbi:MULTISPECIES: hypothetical protein [Vibrio harveyi group]|uniref:Lipoprotein n=1 Tax=Vibrio parahaemolyticus TaxID=670 RepID=A0AA46UQL6_VIBPH|nr:MULTISPECIES: hypothetical protein [Vibrio harveyi group]MCS0310769.1 hypothetical protein [Vibrio diabolicus]UYV29955.1 hypothetical protein M5598_28635 [Vibrio parahaemolyticus]UYW19004.1 hypothetical protein IF561_27655 [Vibrio parahaemolyticus]